MQHTCEMHPDLSDCPDSLIVRLGEPGSFGLRVHDGGTSVVRIRYCPWCGTDLWSNRHSGSGRVFLLWHVHQFDDGREDEKLIGAYSSKQDARDAQERLSAQPGFRDHTEGFGISEYDLGKDDWTEGFVTVE
jgi:hypothetical protein